MFKVEINTDGYKKMRCSKNTWEKGTINDFMEAINHWCIIEEDLQSLKWRIKTFAKSALDDNWDYDNDCYTDKYLIWRDKIQNTLYYYDKFCEFNRTTDISVYGFAQGYFSVDSVLHELDKYGGVEIPFKWCYDSRQYIKNYDKCYMKITKLS